MPAIPAGLLKGELRELLEAAASEFGSIETEASANFYRSADAGENPQPQGLLLEIEAAVTDVEVTHSLTSEVAVNRSLLNSGSEIVPAKTEVEAPAPEETDVASNITLQDAIPYGIALHARTRANTCRRISSKRYLRSSFTLDSQ